MSFVEDVASGFDISVGINADGLFALVRSRLRVKAVQETSVSFSPRLVSSSAVFKDRLHYGVLALLLDAIESEATVDVVTQRAIDLYAAVLSASLTDTRLHCEEHIKIAFAAADYIRFGGQLQLLSAATLSDVAASQVRLFAAFNSAADIAAIADGARSISAVLADQFAAATSLESLLTAYVNFADELSAEDRAFIDQLILLECFSALQAAVEADAYSIFPTALASHAVFDGTTGAAVSISFLLNSSSLADSSVDSAASLLLQLQSAAVASGFFQIGEDIYEGWVYHTEGRGFTQYTNFPFTDVAEFNGRYYGVADDGIYLLEGDTDDGAPIQAAIRTGLLDFEVRQLKDAKAMYIGYTSAGQIVLKVVTTGKGDRREDWYRMKHGSSDAMRTGRFDIQRGLRSTYWQFELCNVDGADFEIDDATLVYRVLSRRIR